MAEWERGRAGMSEVKLPDEKRQLEMVYNEDISVSLSLHLSHLRYLRIVFPSHQSSIVAARSVF